MTGGSKASSAGQFVDASSPAIPRQKAPDASKGKSKSQAGDSVAVKRPAPKVLTGCQGSCSKSSLVGLADGLAELGQAMQELGDYLISPMEAGPFLQNPAIMGLPPEAVAKMDRLWELRLCIEMLRDSLDTYDTSGATLR
eukprot:TRINITY_DN15601_c0_g1_i1.p1 TRINITY_DN15601_c0_g1~~TRINITY_DN15601_c0_g1_i1.p1  ORF type:complete len:140 (+),score=23.47 TRINITY_DN15601_c0_g1_i1:54-473(+)